MAKQTFDMQISEVFYELMKEVNMRDTEGKLISLKMPSSMRKWIDVDMAEIEKTVGIKINLATYLLVCAMVVGRFGENDKHEFYRLKNRDNLLDYLKDNQNRLQVEWAKIMREQRKYSR